jgi:predicted DNA-binding protein YlxM (UPF0122 family)
MELENKVKLNTLYDIYGELLTEKQKEYYEYYYLQDYSLSEISEILSVSRNAVHTQLKNVVQHLEDYEQKLKLYEKKTIVAKLIHKIENETISMDAIKKELERV